VVINPFKKENLNKKVNKLPAACFFKSAIKRRFDILFVFNLLVDSSCLLFFFLKGRALCIKRSLFDLALSGQRQACLLANHSQANNLLP